MRQGGHCARTGEKNCKCIHPKPQISPLQVNLQAVVRKLFTDHAVITAFAIKSIVDDGGDADAILVPRLMQNQKEIGDALKPIIGEANGNLVTQVLSQHIDLAGQTAKAAKRNDPDIETFKANLLTQGDDVAEVLTSLNPDKLPYAETQPMFRMHNQFVIDMTVARLQKRFADEQRLYDAYYAEMLEMSDAIVAAL